MFFYRAIQSGLGLFQPNIMNQKQNSCLIGTAIDVSGSMKDKFPKSLQNDLEVSKIDSIFTLIDDIIKHEPDSDNLFFSLAFGLEDYPSCDLIQLLEYLFPPPEKQFNLLTKLLSQHGLSHDCIEQNKDGNYTVNEYPLIQLLQSEGVENCEKYVKKYVKKEDAGRFFTIFAQDKKLLKELVKGLPYSCRKNNFGTLGLSLLNISAGFLTIGFYDSEKKVVDSVEHEVERAKKLEEKYVHQLLTSFSKKPPQIYTYKQAFSILKMLSTSNKNGEMDSNVLVETIEKYIYGGTPMCYALNQLKPLFSQSNDTEQILVLVSDGAAADGDPEPICDNLKKMGVKIFSCFLSTNNLPFPRRLYDQPEASWDKEQLKMFKMSSFVPATSSSLVILRNQGWIIPLSGEVRLYAQVNHPQIVREFTNLVHHISESDVLIDLIGLISLEVYINNTVGQFKPQNQFKDAVCYAHVVATVQHLVLSRIFGDVNKYRFEKIKENLINGYGKEGASTESVLAETCESLSLQYKEVDEKGARQALLERRPVAAIFKLDETEWVLFNQFYENDKKEKGVLEAKDLFHQGDSKEGDGHAVVLIRCNHDSLTFMNSWGTEWGDAGFFSVRDAQVLRMKFFDVSYQYSEEESNLNIMLQNRHVINQTQNLLDEIPKCLRKLPYKCPCCEKENQINKFEGNVFQAVCPCCKNVFKPTGVDLLVNLYTRSYQNIIEPEEQNIGSGPWGRNVYQCDALADINKKEFNIKDNRFLQQNSMYESWLICAATVYFVIQLRRQRQEKISLQCLIDKMSQQFQFKRGNPELLFSTLLSEVSKKYDLKLEEVGELGARKALLKGRPVATVFEMSYREFYYFLHFFQRPTERVLEEKDMNQKMGQKEIELAVVLTSCDRDSLTFINTWGRQWGNSGFFKLRNAKVLRMKFFDVYPKL